MRGGRWLRVLSVAALVTVAAGGAQQPPPSITVTPACSNSRPSGLELRFTGTMFVPGGEVLIYFDWPRDDNIVARDDLGQDYRFNASGFVTPSNQPDPAVGGYVVAARQPRRPNDTVTTVFRVPCPRQTPPTTSTTQPPRTTTTVPPPTQPVFNPTLTLSPPMGPPGFVATANGTGWPAGSVTIGVTAGGEPITATADARGTFSVSILVLPGTSLGQLAVQGSGAGGVTATGSFLVVPHSAGPPIWNH